MDIEKIDLEYERCTDRRGKVDEVVMNFDEVPVSVAGKMGKAECVRDANDSDG